MGGLIGGIIGFLLTRRIWGAILGYMIGSAFTNVKTFRNGEGSRSSFAGGFGSMGGGHNQGYYRQQINKNDFATALLVLSGAVMKADGKVLKSELDYVKAFLNQQFSPQFANEQIRNFKDILKKDFNLSQVCSDIVGVMPHQQRSVLVQYLFGIAKADGHVSESEVKVIQQMNPPDLDLFQPKNWTLPLMKLQNILTVSKTDSTSPVTKTYRQWSLWSQYIY